MKFNMDKGTHLKSSQTTNKMMRNLIIALIPIVIFSFYKNGILPYLNNKSNILGLFYPLIFILVSTISSLVAEYLYYRFVLSKKTDMKQRLLFETFSLIPGLFLGLILPINTPLFIVILGSAGATIFGKMIFGGFGQNIFNPALIGNLLIISVYSVVITNQGGYLNNMELDAIASSTPLSNIAPNTIGTYDSLIKPFGTLWDFFTGTIPGAIGETSALLCIVGFIYLTFTKTIKWKIPVVYIGTVFIMTWMIGSYNQLGIWYPLFQILSGGLMFGAVFMATDPVTSPTTPIGQVIYGFFLGVLTVIFRYLTPYPEGVLTSILLLNLFVFLIDKSGFKMRFNFGKSIFIIIWLIILLLSFYIGNKYKTKEIDDFKIISKTTSNNITTYEVSDKGYVDNIIVKISIENNKVIKYEVISQKESYYGIIEQNDYINTLIKNSNKIADVDTISGATYTSRALKGILEKTIKDFEKENGKITENNKVEEKKTFEILEKDQSGLITTYVATNLGFVGNIKARVVVNNGHITSFKIIESNESYMQKIDDSAYIDLITGNSENINNIDAVSGATYTSKAIKNLALKVLEDYNKQVNE